MEVDLMNIVTDLMYDYNCWLVGDIVKFICAHIASTGIIASTSNSDSTIDLSKQFLFDEKDKKRFLRTVKNIDILPNDKRLYSAVVTIKEAYPKLNCSIGDGFQMKKGDLFWSRNGDERYLFVCNSDFKLYINIPFTFDVASLATREDIQKLLRMSPYSQPEDDSPPDLLEYYRDGNKEISDWKKAQDNANEKFVKFIYALMGERDLYLFGDIIKFIARRYVTNLDKFKHMFSDREEDIEDFGNLVKTIKIFSPLPQSSEDVIKLINKYYKTDGDCDYNRSYNKSGVITTSLRVPIFPSFGESFRYIFRVEIYHDSLPKGEVVWGRYVYTYDRFLLYKYDRIWEKRVYGPQLTDAEISQLRGDAPLTKEVIESKKESAELKKDEDISPPKTLTLIEKIENAHKKMYNETTSTSNSTSKVFLKYDTTLTPASLGRVYCGIGDFVIHGTDEETVLKKLLHILTME